MCAFHLPLFRRPIDGQCQRAPGLSSSGLSSSDLKSQCILDSALLNQTFQSDKSESFNDLSSAVIQKEKQIQMKKLCIFILVK